MHLWAYETWDLGVVILPTVEINLWYARCCNIFTATPSSCNIFTATPRSCNIFTATPTNSKASWVAKEQNLHVSILLQDLALFRGLLTLILMLNPLKSLKNSNLRKLLIT